VTEFRYLGLEIRSTHAETKKASFAAVGALETAKGLILKGLSSKN
jgi:3-hydroxy-3-methylglutaryl CoA synthase